MKRLDLTSWAYKCLHPPTRNIFCLFLSLFSSLFLFLFLLFHCNSLCQRVYLYIVTLKITSLFLVLSQSLFCQSSFLYIFMYVCFLFIFLLMPTNNYLHIFLSLWYNSIFSLKISKLFSKLSWTTNVNILQLQVSFLSFYIWLFFNIPVSVFVLFSFLSLFSL